MFFRFIVFQVVFVVLAAASAIGLAIRDGVNESLSENPKAAVRAFRQYPLPIGCGCAGVAFLAAFGDALLPRRRKAGLPTYSDEEFIAKFGGNRRE
jgi:hypothetical protein